MRSSFLLLAVICIGCAVPEYPPARSPQDSTVLHPTVVLQENPNRASMDPNYWPGGRMNIDDILPDVVYALVAKGDEAKLQFGQFRGTLYASSFARKSTGQFTDNWSSLSISAEQLFEVYESIGRRGEDKHFTVQYAFIVNGSSPQAWINARTIPQDAWVILLLNENKYVLWSDHYSKEIWQKVKAYLDH